jgi:hypothetical protein
MPAQPHRKPDGRGADDPPKEIEKAPSELFRTLASRLVGVPIAEVREAERLYAEKKAAKHSDA